MWVRSWYYSSVTADPKDENVVYVMNLTILKSIDGGKTFKEVDVQHGDTHRLWIDPADPNRMILGDDGGATVTFDGATTWSSQHNQPTAQFYHVNTDDQFPYRIYGGQQDNSAISIASRSDDGGIGVRDYFSVAGCENATVAVRPAQPEHHVRRLLPRHVLALRSRPPAGARHLGDGHQLGRLRREGRAGAVPVDLPGAGLQARSAHALRDVAARLALARRGRTPGSASVGDLTQRRSRDARTHRWTRCTAR